MKIIQVVVISFRWLATPYHEDVAVVVNVQIHTLARRSQRRGRGGEDVIGACRRWSWLLRVGHKAKRPPQVVGRVTEVPHPVDGRSRGDRNVL